MIRSGDRDPKLQNSVALPLGFKKAVAPPTRSAQDKRDPLHTQTRKRDPNLQNSVAAGASVPNRKCDPNWFLCWRLVGSRGLGEFS